VAGEVDDAHRDQERRAPGDRPARQPSDAADAVAAGAGDGQAGDEVGANQNDIASPSAMARSRVKLPVRFRAT
jgi:hypothetical protein